MVDGLIARAEERNRPMLLSGRLRGALRWCVRAIFTLVVVIFTILLVAAFDARRAPDLKPWHTASLESEATAPTLEAASFDEYLEIEARVFEEYVAEVEGEVADADRTRLNRFFAGSDASPGRFEQNWNRTFEWWPEEAGREVIGGALLVHGLTDSPYSVRHIGQILRDAGYYVLAIRLPGHGTAPVALTRSSWQDWMAAVGIGAARVREQIGEGAPLVLGGYSNGGALVTKYALDASEDPTLAHADRILLFSPMIGVTTFARFVSWNKLLSGFDYFEKFRWLTLEPEFDPFKYNSFPKEAGHQSFLLTQVLQNQIRRLARGGVLDLPPVLTFQSVVDSTVLTRAIVDEFYVRLSPGDDELVLFDVNRRADMADFLRRPNRSFVDGLEARALPFSLTVVTNSSASDEAVVARYKPIEATAMTTTPLNLTWPRSFYSLSHVAMVFPPHDELYGANPTAAVPIGAIQARGERNVLRVSMENLMRARHNPFFDYLAQRIRTAIATDRQ
jgi:alpha-beta hydrolase superfamily lysophospholipase